MWHALYKLNSNYKAFNCENHKIYQINNNNKNKHTTDVDWTVNITSLCMVFQNAYKNSGNRVVDEINQFCRSIERSNTKRPFGKRSRRLTAICHNILYIIQYIFTQNENSRCIMYRVSFVHLIFVHTYYSPPTSRPLPKL